MAEGYGKTMSHFPFFISEFKLEVQLSKHYERQSYREAVMSHSPGLLRPWVGKWISFSTRNGLRQLDATALRLKLAIQFISQGCRSVKWSPDGTELLIPVAEVALDDAEHWDNSPEDVIDQGVDTV